MAEKIFENEYVICELDESVPLLKHRWLQEPSSHDFKKNLLKILKKYEELKDSYDNLMWLAHTALLGELDEEVEQWLNSTWDALLFKKAGVKVHAVILGSDIFADYPMEKFKHKAEKKFSELGVKLDVFPNEERAYAWLKSQK
ncbi:MAG: hypothetical protein R3345_10810 [Fulvivirga sp.]|nr:hypothetical protein [Fulvivirga sp.]